MLTFSLLVSLSFTFGHLVAGEITPAALNSVRFAIAALTMLGFAFVMGVPIKPIFQRFWRFAIIGGLMGVYFITMFESLRVTSAVSTAAIFTLTPLMAAGFGLLLAGQRASRLSLVALTIGAIGALWVIFRGDLEAFLKFQIGRGEALFMIGALAHALVPGLLRRLAPNELPLQSSIATILGALLIASLYGARDLIETDYASLRPLVWMVIGYLALITTGGTFFLLQYANKRLQAGKVMAYTYLVPSWVVLWDFLLYGKTQPVLLLAGVGATLVALLMLLKGDATKG